MFKLSRALAFVFILYGFSISLAGENPPYFGMDKSQYDYCIALGKAVMNAQRTEPDSPQHKAAYRDWNKNCGISVMLKLSEKQKIRNFPISPLDWTNFE